MATAAKSTTVADQSRFQALQAALDAQQTKLVSNPHNRRPIQSALEAIRTDFSDLLAPTSAKRDIQAIRKFNSVGQGTVITISEDPMVDLLVQGLTPTQAREALSSLEKNPDASSDGKEAGQVSAPETDLQANAGWWGWNAVSVVGQVIYDTTVVVVSTLANSVGWLRNARELPPEAQAELKARLTEIVEQQETEIAGQQEMQASTRQLQIEEVPNESLPVASQQALVAGSAASESVATQSTLSTPKPQMAADERPAAPARKLSGIQLRAKGFEQLAAESAKPKPSAKVEGRPSLATAPSAASGSGQKTGTNLTRTSLKEDGTA